MIARMKWGEQLFQGGKATQAANVNANSGRRIGPQVAISANTILGKITDPRAAVARILEVLDDDLLANKVDSLVALAISLSNGRISAGNANTVCRQVAKLLCCCPEFQMG